MTFEISNKILADATVQAWSFVTFVDLYIQKKKIREKFEYIFLNTLQEIFL